MGRKPHLLTPMVCRTCANLVLQNDTGICLSCQRGFVNRPQEDDYDFLVKDHLEQRQKEIEDALQKHSSKKMDVRQQAKNGKAMAKRNTKIQKTPKKG